MDGQARLITKIEELDKKRVRIFMDDEFAFVLYKGELRRYKIEEGLEIGTAEYEEIVGEILPKRAKLRSMNLLKARAYTERQLRDKLHQGEYPEEIIEEAVSYVKSFGYINDRQYALDFIFCHMENRSRMRMEQDLMAKGVQRDTIREVMEELAEKGEQPDETAMAKELLRKKIMIRKWLQIKKNGSWQHFYIVKDFKWM